MKNIKQTNLIIIIILIFFLIFNFNSLFNKIKNFNSNKKIIEYFSPSELAQVAAQQIALKQQEAEQSNSKKKKINNLVINFNNDNKDVIQRLNQEINDLIIEHEEDIRNESQDIQNEINQQNIDAGRELVNKYLDEFLDDRIAHLSEATDTMNDWSENMVNGPPDNLVKFYKENGRTPPFWKEQYYIPTPRFQFS